MKLVDHIDEVADRVGRDRLWFFSTKADQAYTEVRYRRGDALVLGPESRGLPARWLAERIHGAGMSAGLSAPSEMTAELWPTFDFGLGIGCIASTGCSEYAPFDQAKKTVLHIELGDAKAAVQLCKSAQALGFDALISDPGFTGQCTQCRDIL